MRVPTVLVAAVVLGALSHIMDLRCLAADPHPPMPLQRAINLEVLILRTQKEANADQTWDLSGRSDEVAKRIRQLEADGKIVAIERIQMMTIEHQSSVLQNGKSVPIPTAQMMSGRGGPTRTSYEQYRIGTLVTASTVVGQSGIIVNLEIEKSQLGPRESNSADNDEFKPISTETLTFETTVQVGNGMTVLVGHLEERSESETTQQMILVSARCLPLPEGSIEVAAEDETASRLVRMFPLRNAPAEQAGAVLREISGNDPRKTVVSVDVRTNSLIVSAESEKSLESIEAILTRLDQSSPHQAKPTPEKTRKGDAKPAVSKYDKMGKKDLQAELKRLQNEVLVASRAGVEAKEKANKAAAAYRHAADGDKFETLLRVLEADAASRKPLEYHSRIRSELEQAQAAYMRLLLGE